MYSSRSNRYPNSSDHEKASYFELDYIRYTQELDTQVNGSYYITIEAFSYADYIITPVIIRKGVNVNVNNSNNNSLIKYTRLIEGQPVKKTFHSISLRSYFKVKVIFGENEVVSARSVLVSVKPITTSYKTYISFTDRDPSENDFDYEVFDNELMFSDIENNIFKFKIMVMVDNSTTLEELGRYQFEIYYATSKGIIPLTFHPYYDTLSEDQTKFFSINFDPKVSDITITRAIFTLIGTHSIDLWVFRPYESIP